MKLRLVALAAAMLLVATAPAHAGPIIVAVAAVATWAGASAVTATAIATAVVGTAITTGLSYVSQALFGGSARSAPFGLSQDVKLGGTVSRSFLIGEEAPTAGSEIYPRRTWGKDGGTPNAYYTKVIQLSDLPLGGLTAIIHNGKRSLYSEAGIPTMWGYPITEYRKGGKDYLWALFYDGTQTAADPWLVSQFGSDPDYPFTSDMVGHGCAYVIITALVNQEQFPSFPDYLFAAVGTPFYDPRADDTVGGDGDQRWDDPATWAVTGNPALVKYNVLRGISYAGQWLYGGQGTAAARLPLDVWFAAMNADDAEMETAPGITEASFRCAGEVVVNTAPADFLDELNKCDNGRLTEAGGIFLTRSGAVGAPVMTFTEKDLLVTEAKTFDPFPGLEQTVNGISAQHPDPDQNWVMVDAPALYNPEWEAADGDRRLIASIQYTFVPYPRRVQVLQKAAAAEHRKFRKHNVMAPPRAFALLPFSIIALTSPENGYVNKLFEAVPVDQDNLDQGLVLKEVDPADYNFDADTDHQAYTAVPVVSRPPPVQNMVDWFAEGAPIVGDGGRGEPGISLAWATEDIDDVDGVFFEVRRASTAAIVKTDQTPHSIEQFLLGEVLIGGGFSPDTEYEVRGKYRAISSRDTEWSDWLAVTTPATKVLGTDIEPGTIPGEAFAEGIGAVGIVATLADLPADNSEYNVVVVEDTGALYRWDDTAGAWTSEVPAVDVGPGLTNAQIADVAAAKITGQIINSQIAAAAIDASKLAAGITAPGVGTSLPVSGSSNPLFYNQTDGQLYRWSSGAWTTAVPAASVGAGLTSSQIASVAAATVTGTLTDAQLSAIAAAKITGQVVNNQIATGAITASNLASSIVAAEPLSSLPGSGNFEGRLVYNTTDGQLYRYHSGAFTTAVPAASVGTGLTSSQIASVAAATITGTLVTSQIGSGQITAALIASAAITATQLAANSVGNTQLALAAVTAAKTSLAAIDSSTGNLTAGSVTAANIVAGTITSTQIASGTIAAVNIAAGAIGTTALAAGAVTAAKITAGTITSTEIAAGTIVAGNIASATITGTLIAAGTITASNIAAGTITATQIASNTITAGLIAAGAIGATQIAANAITASKLYIGSTDNLVLDAQTTDAGYWHAFGNGFGTQTGGSPIWTGAGAAGAPTACGLNIGSTSGGAGGMYSSSAACQAGDKFYLSVGAWVAAGGQQMNAYASWFNNSGSLYQNDLIGSVTTASAPGVTVEGIATAPAGAVGVAILLYAVGGSQNFAAYQPVIRRMYTGALIVNGSITAANIAAGTLTATQIAAGTIVAGNIASATITGTQIAAATIAAANIVAGTITSAQIAASTITGSNIAAGTITASNIMAGTITASQIASNTITAGQIAAGAIGATQIAANAVSASKVFIGATDNLVLDAALQDIASWQPFVNVAPGYSLASGFSASYGTDNILAFSSTASGAGGVSSKVQTCQQGDVFYLSAYVGLGGTSGTVGQVYAMFYNATGTNIANTLIGQNTAPGTIALLAGSATAPAGAAYTALLIYLTSGSKNAAFGQPIQRRMATGSLIVDGTITAAKIASATITSTQIAAGTIVASNIAASTITSTQIAAATITGTNIAAGTITATHLSANSVTAGAIAAGAVNATTIIASNVIITGHISAHQITVPTIGTAAPVTLTTSFGTIISLTITTTGGDVQLDWSGYTVWNGSGTAPEVDYQVVRDPAGVSTNCGTMVGGGGSSVMLNIPMTGGYLDTNVPAGTHTYVLSGKVIGASVSARANALRLCELLR